MEIGYKIGRLTIINQVDDYVSNSGKRIKRFLCECDCGNKKIFLKSNLNKDTKSCGCLRIEKMSQRTRKHLEAPDKTPEYRAWACMKKRCYNPRNASYKHYGGRGIIVCDEWKNSYQNFLDYMGRKPNPTWSIDRIDPNGNYEIGNVRWASPELQNKNKRNKN